MEKQQRNRHVLAVITDLFFSVKIIDAAKESIGTGKAVAFK